MAQEGQLKRKNSGDELKEKSQRDISSSSTWSINNDIDIVKIACNNSKDLNHVAATENCEGKGGAEEQPELFLSSTSKMVDDYENSSSSSSSSDTMMKVERYKSHSIHHERVVAGPVLGFTGTFHIFKDNTIKEERSIKLKKYSDLLKTSIEAGYRAFNLIEKDMADMDMGSFGKALASSGIPREEFTVIGKLDGIAVGIYDDLKERIGNFLEAIGVTYFDVLLIQYPLKTGADLGAVPTKLVTKESWGWFLQNIGVSWKHMTQLKSEGLTRHVGVSNFYLAHLEELNRLIQSSASELAPISVNELYIDAAHPEFEVVEYCESVGIQCLAYRALAFMGVYSFVKGLKSQLNETSFRYGFDTPQQLVLAWLRSRQIFSVTSSSNKSHIIDNLNSFTSFARQSVPREVLQFVVDQVEDIDMFGGVDEYAAAFKQMEILSRET